MSYCVKILVSLIFIFGCTQNSFSLAKQSGHLNQTYVGQLGNKVDVVFNLATNSRKLTGFYYYQKVGIEIKLTGEIKNGDAVLYELDYQHKKQAKITGLLTSDGFMGKWQSLTTKKTYAVKLKVSKNKIPALPKNLIGTYQSDEQGCQLSLSIAKVKDLYFYNFRSKTRNIKGKVTFGRSLEENLVYINFDGIEWSEDEGDVSGDRGNEVEKFRVLPTVVQGLLEQEKIGIQNSGNAMNRYVKIGECDEKYIYLKKKSSAPLKN